MGYGNTLLLSTLRCETSLLNELGDAGPGYGSELRARINTFDEDGFSTVLVRCSAVTCRGMLILSGATPCVRQIR